jgi:hypothetical protein
MDASVDVRLRTYLFWSFWAGVAFFAIYPAMNWITSLRRAPFHLYLTRELAIPFVPLFIWPYLSTYLLFITSTVLVHQHHLLDVIAALAIVFFLRRQYEVHHA